MILFPSSVQFSHSVMSDSLWAHGLQHTRLPCPSPSPGAYSNSCPLSQWCQPITSSSGPQSFPASGSFPMSRKFQLEFWYIKFSKINRMNREVEGYSRLEKQREPIQYWDLYNLHTTGYKFKFPESINLKTLEHIQGHETRCKNFMV